MRGGCLSDTRRQVPFPALGEPLRSLRVTVKWPGTPASSKAFSESTRASTETNPSRKDRSAERVSPPSSVTSAARR